MHRSSEHNSVIPSRYFRPSSITAKGRLRRAASTVLVGLMAVASGGTPLSAETASENKPAAYSPKSEGFTRESMAELSRPEPPPAPRGPLVSPRVVRPQVDGKDFAPHRVSSSRRIAQTETDGKDYGSERYVARRMQRARPDERRIASRARSHRRNPAESFVFWWNGWVIRTFHTKVGTVMLGTIGAKS